MENFIVSARKYRPTTFDMVVGQDSITTTLKNAIRNNHLAQAFLFCGPRGVGKTTCARILAKTINCFNPTPDLEPCNVCDSCVSFNSSNSFNIHELDAASNNSVDDIRNLVDQVRIPPQVGKYKVYIIDEVHMLSPAAFNAFLKTLEEPPSYAKFILATTEKHKIIPTILSRCQIFDFKRIGVGDIAKHLAYVAQKENVKASEEALHIIAQKADGAMRDALSIFDQLVVLGDGELTYETVITHLNVLDYTYYFSILDHILQGDTSNILLIFNDIIERGFDGQHFITGLGEHLRSLLVCKDPETVKLLDVAGNIKARYAQQAETCPAGFLLKALEIINTCDINYRTSNHKRLLIELSLLQMCSILDEKKNFLAKTAFEDKKEEVKPKSPSSKTEEQAKPPDLAPDKSKATPVGQSSKTSKGIGPKTISIRPENYTSNNALKPQETITTSGNASSFSQEQLDKVWKYFSESIAKQYPNFYSIISTRIPTIKEDFTLELKLENKFQDMEIQERKSDLLEFLRNELNNSHLLLSTVIDESAQVTRPYSPEEKYKAMITKNPLLKDLTEKLDLELDY